MSTIIENATDRSMISGHWAHEATITTTEFKFKSLSEWVFNTTIGCSHGCRFCYVPSTSANKQARKLELLGVLNPDAEWGNYVFLRQWDEKKFLATLRSAERRPNYQLKPEGHRAVMFCSTTDPYQVIANPDLAVGKKLTQQHQGMIRKALELIRDHSTLNVRILTRSGLAKLDFELLNSFGNRLLFGMSLPTLNNRLAKVFEPHAPAPSQRLQTLQAAKDAGLNIYVAMAPTYPDCDEDDLRATLTAIKELDPLTVFHEPINIRADNVERIRIHAEAEGVTLKTSDFESSEAWNRYAVDQLLQVERIATEVGLGEKIHLWPDQDLAKKSFLQSHEDPTSYVNWLTKWWTRVSEWAA